VREGRRDPGARGYGWLATLGGAALLLLLGFGVGLLTGSLFEEPDLVARQLSGEAEEHPLPAPPPESGGEPAPSPPDGAVSADAGTAPTPAAAAPGEAPSDFDPGAEERSPPAASPGAAAPAATPHPEPAKPAGAPAVATAPPPAPATAPLAPARAPAPPPVSARGPGFAVQVGAFAERAAADQLVGSLRGDRFAAYLVEGKPGEGARFRVRVGPFASREEASGQASQLKERRRLPTWVIREGGP
jgi:cell division septation protein DedD